MAAPYFVSPAEGRFTSDYGYRTHPVTGARQDFHRGIDIANVPGTIIVAAYGGIVRVVGDAGSGKNYWNPVTGKRNSGRFLIIDGPGGGSEFYGHIRKALVKAGDRVVAGQPIAEMGATGNVTGPHLHYEEWGNRSHLSHRNPIYSFNKYGVKVGSKPKVVKTPPKNQTPDPKPVNPIKGAKVSKTHQKYLASLGFYKGAIDGIAGSHWRNGVNAYIRAQLYKPGLKADGVYGPAAQAHSAWVKQLQRAMNNWKGTKVRVDGSYGRATRARVLEIMKRNKGGAYKGSLDGVPGPAFCKMLGIPTHPGL